MYGFMSPSAFGPQSTLLVGANTSNVMGATAASAPASLSGGSFMDFAGSAGGAMSIAGAVSSAVGAYYSARSAKNSIKHQARMAEINAQISELGAKSALLQGQRQEQASRLAAGQLKSRQRVSMAANGIDLASDTPQNILNTTDFMSEADALTIQRNALQAAWGYRTQATNQQIGATMARADAGGVSPFVSAATSLVGSATAVASRWYAGQQLRM